MSGWDHEDFERSRGDSPGVRDEDRSGTPREPQARMSEEEFERTASRVSVHALLAGDRLIREARRARRSEEELLRLIEEMKK